jgi:PAS domain S-box-containing protein
MVIRKSTAPQVVEQIYQGVESLNLNECRHNRRSIIREISFIMEKKAAIEIFGPSLFNLLEDLFVIFNINYDLIDISPSCEKMLGHKAQDVIGKNGLEFIHPLDKAKVIYQLESLKQNPQKIIEEVIRVKSSEGTFKYIRLRSTLHPSIEGQLIAIGKDVHEEYLQLYLMKNAETQAQLGHFQYDLKLKKRTWSKSIYDILEIPYHLEITDELATQIYTPLGMKLVKEVLKEAVENKRSWDFEQLLLTYNGQERWVRTKGGPVSENGEVLFVEGIIQDIDTKKKEDLALQEAFRELDKIQQGINNHFIVSKVSP